jgi:hypothetical protein
MRFHDRERSLHGGLEPAELFIKDRFRCVGVQIVMRRIKGCIKLLEILSNRIDWKDRGSGGYWLRTGRRCADRGDNQDRGKAVSQCSSLSRRGIEQTPSE